MVYNWYLSENKAVGPITGLTVLTKASSQAVGIIAIDAQNKNSKPNIQI